ncbi:MAG: signal recognition particle subunit SRP19/SEC65 family protein [Euryarchaeota archaeon]|nr:signal recognition particle subunit SRP19/SEC65 family protein [Euryarchaeota archaeon]
MPQTDKIVIWPTYFDSTVSRKDGRRVAKRYALKSPATGEIAEATITLGLDPIVEQDKAYPASWWKKSGRVLVKKTGNPKSSVLREIGSIIKEMRRTD